MDQVAYNWLTAEWQNVAQLQAKHGKREGLQEWHMIHRRLLRLKARYPEKVEAIRGLGFRRREAEHD